MESTVARIGMIGFGEAASTFAAAMSSTRDRIIAFDIKTDQAATRGAKRADYAALGITGAEAPAEAVIAADVILSLVTADQAVAAAQSVCGAMRPGAIFCDMNSVAPQSKRAAAQVVESAGGRYADVAIMAPVQPQALAVPLLIAGPHADAAAAALQALGFAQISVVDGPIGAASAVKMIRSVMIKGLEALSAECFLAAAAAGVSEQVIASLDASWPGAGWAARAEYNLERMIVHGQRRAAEMDEAEKMLAGLGLTGSMTRAAAEWQRGIGALAISPPPGLAAKIAAILGQSSEAA